MTPKCHSILASGMAGGLAPLSLSSASLTGRSRSCGQRAAHEAVASAPTVLCPVWAYLPAPASLGTPGSPLQMGHVPQRKHRALVTHRRFWKLIHHLLGLFALAPVWPVGCPSAPMWGSGAYNLSARRIASSCRVCVRYERRASVCQPSCLPPQNIPPSCSLRRQSLTSWMGRNVPASALDAGAWYMLFKGNPASPGRANDSTARVESCLTASWYAGLGLVGVGASLVRHSEMKRMR